MSRVPFVDLRAQADAIRHEMDAAVRDVLARADWILGRDVQAFEEEFAEHCHAGGAVGVDSGLSALELTLRAFGIGAGDEVITAANTFVATALAISHAGATPVLVDCDPRTYTIDPAGIEAAITDRTRALVPVHLYGHPAGMDAVSEIARAHDLVVIEDAAQAHGARWRRRPVGSLGHAAAFSFYPSKNLGAAGDGGAVVSDDGALLDEVRMLRNYGQREKHVHEVKGYNRRLDTLQAAILRVKLPHLDEWNAQRRERAARYAARLEGAVDVPQAAPGVDPVWHLYVVRVRDRDRCRATLGEHGVETGVHYPVPVHLLPAYADLGHGPGAFPVTEAAAAEVLSLPMYPELPLDAVDRVVDALGRHLARGQAA